MASIASRNQLFHYSLHTLDTPAVDPPVSGPEDGRTGRLGSLIATPYSRETRVSGT